MKTCHLKWFNQQVIKKRLATLLAISLISMTPITTFAKAMKNATRKNNPAMQTSLKSIELQESNSSPSTSSNAVEQSNQQRRSRQIKGVIKDATGEPIIGASVFENGNPANGTITNINGEYTLTTSGNQLVISFVGYVPQTITLKENSSIYNITLQEDTKVLDEVVVVGYGIQKKANLTGSVASVNAQALESRAVANVSAALAGQMPGVTTIQGSGAPGLQTGTITIRGKNSINAASPLVIVDGVPGSMNTVDPQDIESLTVLKDAASAAIYGVQAANGVILITTKTGKKNTKTKVTYSGLIGWSSPTTLLKFLGSADYAMLYNEAVKNENPKAALPYSDEDIQKFRDGSDPIGHPNTDWYKETFKSSAMETMHNFSLNGGSDKSVYSASVGYLHQGGLVKENDYNKFNARMNMESELNEYFKVGVNLSGYRGIRNTGWEGYESLRQFSNRLSPTIAVRDAQGNYTYNGMQNPVAHLGTTGNRKYTDQQINGILQATVSIIPKELTLKGVYSLRHDIRNNEGYKKLLKYGNYSSGLREGYEEYYSWNWYTTQLLANWNKDFGNHTVAALGGFEQVEHIYKFTKATRKGGGNDELNESLNTLDKSSQTNDDGGYETARRSYFGRVQYDYLDKYLFEANIRWDASSRFPKDNRWGMFPAFSAGWRASEESFIKDNAKWISNLKFRLGWGKTGNEELDNDDIYPAVATYGYDSYMFNNTLYSTAKESRYVNRNLKWATVTNYELGVEAAFLNNLLGFELSLYKKKTNDMLLYLPVQGVLGMDPPAQNAGNVENKGFDLSIFHNKNITKDLSYALNLNVAYVKNEITNMSGTEGPNKDDDKIWYLEGNAIGSYYGYKAIGFFNTPEDLKNSAKRTNKETLGDIKYADISGPDGKPDGKIDASDRTVIGKNFPSWTGGFNITLFYKDFDFSALFQGAFDVDNYYTGEASYAFFNGSKVLEKHLDRWTPDNHNASYPRITKDTQINYSTSSFWLQDASYVRLKNITLGYNLPKMLLNKIGVERIKVFVTGENLLTFTGLDGIDPEGSTGRGAYYTNMKKVSLGLKVSF